jgi:peptide deformylase
MQQLKILTGPNPILERVCRPNFTIPEWLIREMFRLMRENRGLGLAACQVGIDARLFITHWDEVFINPTLTAHGEYKRRITEGCLSFPGQIGVMERWDWVEINGRRYGMEEAIVVQHELDHLNGITIV